MLIHFMLIHFMLIHFMLIHFMLIHYYDLHDEYAPPEPFASTFKDDPYADEIAYAGKCIGQVTDKLKNLAM